MWALTPRDIMTRLSPVINNGFPMPKVNIHQAKTHFSRYVEEAAQGKETIIARAGKPVARIAPLVPVKTVRKLGLLDGKARIPADFNSTLPDEMLAEFLGGK